MAKIEQVRRGQIHMAYLDPAFAREIGGYKPRPVMILSINDLHRNTGVVTVVPGTSTASAYRNIVRIEPSPQNGLSAETYFLCHQIRSIDHARLMPLAGTGNRFAEVSRTELEAVEDAMMFSLGLFGFRDIEELRRMLRSK